MPGLLLLVARDLLLHDPPRVLAWRILHDERLAAVPGWLGALLPRPDPGLDRDPVALLLGGLAVLTAAVYAIVALRGARPAVRASLLAASAACLVVAPTIGFVAMGHVTGRPYGQDGGVVQLPLAIDKILSGESPYGADYSDSILGKEARASDFWAPFGGNPILRHHAYLPGTHLLMLPSHLLARADPRCVTLIAYVLAAFAATRLVATPLARIAAAAVVLVNPLVYWHQIFGANDVLVVALVLLATLLAVRQRTLGAGAVLGLACATKQLAWPFAPFLLVHLAGARSFADLASRDGLRRLLRPALVALAVFVVVVAPVALLDLRRFWGDIVAYNVGLPGADNYPLGGTPGFGFANLLIYRGAVTSLRDYFPFGVFYVLLVPLGLLLVRRQMDDGSAPAALVTGSAALLASLYFSRVVHPNYLVIPAILLPLGLLASGGRWSWDVAVLPLLLLGVAVETADHEVLRTAWEQAVAVRLPQHAGGLIAWLLPRAGPALTLDPLGLLVSALVAGLGVVYVALGVVAPRSARARAVLVGVAAAVAIGVPTLVLAHVGRVSGIVRGQDPWLASIVAESGSATAPAREAWSQSFRRDPPGLLEPSGLSLFDRAAARALGLLRRPDPRPLLLLALALAAALLWRARSADRLLAVGAAILAPLLAASLPFGAPDVMLIAALVGAHVSMRSGWVATSGLILGIATAHAPATLAAVPFLLLAEGSARRGLAGYAAGLGGAALVGWVATPSALIATATPAPGVGLFAVLAYRGVPAAPAVGAVLAGAATLGAWGLALWRRPVGAAALAAAGVALLLVLAVTPGASALDLASPFVLLLLAALGGEGIDEAAAAGSPAAGEETWGIRAA